MDGISKSQPKRSAFEMEPNPPLTAKEAALQGALADKPPFNREADRRHVIASTIRRAAEVTGQIEAAAAAADEIQDGPTTSDGSATSDLSLADLIVADQAASRGFAAPPVTPDGDGPLLDLDSSLDALQTRSWIAGAFDAPIDGSPQSGFSALAGFLDASLSPNLGPSHASIATPDGVPSFKDSNFDVAPPGPFNVQPPDSESPPDLNDYLPLYDMTKPASIELLPYIPADEPGPRFELLTSPVPFTNSSPTPEETAPITYLPFAGNAAAPNGGSASHEKLQVEVTSSFADVKKDATIALLGLEPALLKAIDRAGEQDRRDAFAREASRRACM
jgi:hypothetical protein